MNDNRLFILEDEFDFILGKFLGPRGKGRFSDVVGHRKFSAIFDELREIVLSFINDYLESMGRNNCTLHETGFCPDKEVRKIDSMREEIISLQYIITILEKLAYDKEGTLI